MKSRILSISFVTLLHITVAQPAIAHPMIDPCINAASIKYRVNPDLIRAIIKTESSGRNGIVSGNSNKSQDLGLMQINTIHLPELKKHGITRAQLINDPCTNIGSGTWMLAKHLSKAPPTDQGFWDAVGNYHSKTKKYNTAYQRRVWKNLNDIRRANR